MITRALLALVIILAALVGWSHWRYVRTEAKLDVAEARIVGYEEQQRFLKRMREINEGWDQVEKEIGESDAPLSDYLGSAADRLWP